MEKSTLIAFKFSKHGIQNEKLFCRIYSDFINFCRNNAASGTFSTYMDGEPFFMCNGLHISYSDYLKIKI